MIRLHSVGAYPYYTAICHKCGKESQPLKVWIDTELGLSIDEVNYGWVNKVDTNKTRIYFCPVCKENKNVQG